MNEADCPTHAAACVLVIREPSLVLTIWNAKHNSFGLPGGKREPSDARISKTAHRELNEETGLVGRLIWLAAGLYRFKDNPEREVHLYLARTAEGHIWPKEDKSLAWMTWPWLLQAAPAFREYYHALLPYSIDHLKPTEFLR